MQLIILGLRGTTNFNRLKDATINMSLANKTAALTTSDLGRDQIKQILSSHYATAAELEEAASKILNARATDMATNSNKKLTVSTVSLKTALQGAKAAFLSNPLTAIITIATTAITLISTVSSGSLSIVGVNS